MVIVTTHHNYNNLYQLQSIYIGVSYLNIISIMGKNKSYHEAPPKRSGVVRRIDRREIMTLNLITSLGRYISCHDCRF